MAASSVAGLLASLVLVSQAFAATTRYAAPSPKGTHDCMTPDNACDLKTAIESAGTGDTVQVPGDLGDYSLNSTILAPAGIHIIGTNGMPRLIFSVSFGLTVPGPSSASNLYVEGPGTTFSLKNAPGATAAAVIVRATGTAASNHACYLGGGQTLRDSVCWAGTSGDLAVETDGSNTLRNDDFMGGTRAAMLLIARDCVSSCPVTYTDTVVNVIARAASGGADIATCADSTAIEQVNVSYSNYATTTASPTGCTPNVPANGHITAGTGNETAAPKFVNAAAGDFREVFGSPTIDAGSPAAMCGSIGPDGIGRPDANEPRCDIGAYEFDDTSLPPPDKSAPSIVIATPKDSTHYKQNQKVKASYSCSDLDGPADIALCAGPAQNGKPIDTSTPGKHSFTVQAADKAGNSSKKTVHYTVDTTVSSPPQLKGLPANEGCVPRGLTLNVSVHPKNLTQAIAFLDGKQILVSPKPKFKVKIAAGQLSPGRHKLRIERDYKSGTKRRSTFGFSTCKGGGKSPHIRTQGTPDKGSCTAKPFDIEVTVSGAKLSTISYKLDKRAATKPGKPHFTVHVATSTLARGKHRLTIKAQDKHGNLSTSLTDFVRC